MKKVATWCVSEIVRRVAARRMWHSRDDGSIIKLPSPSSITLQASCWPWCSTRWADVHTHRHTHWAWRKQPHRELLQPYTAERLPAKSAWLVASLQSNWTRGCRRKHGRQKPQDCENWLTYLRTTHIDTLLFHACNRPLMHQRHTRW